MNSLNPEQAEAVACHKGPLLVLAGAGSGKTLVVTRRIAGIMNSGVSPKAILAMTFTNKAAGEMHERVINVAGDRGRDVTICTFHAFGLRVLGSETAALGFPDGKFAIFDQADQASAIREILRGINDGRRYDVWAILTRISKAKNDFVSPKNFDVRPGDEYDEIAEIVYPRYLRALKAFRAFDFDDLVCEVVNLFKKRPDVLQRWRDRYWYLMVDEYQDTNHAQLELVRLLADEKRNVCVVGDDDQSIYAWRGADVSNILDFERHFPGTKVVKLLRNYRSSEAILAVANAVIGSSSARRHDKQLLATRACGEQVRLIVADNPEIEAAFIADETRRLMDEKGIRPGDDAVL
jgi:DNA helicase-2/ATP-dependent DNA helicase PcrA